jgi:hypothetical protein
MSVLMNGKGKRSAIRLVALAICALFIAAMLLSSAYILTHANHIHDHDGLDGGCATCMHIQSAENLLKQLSTAVVSVAAAFAGVLGVLFSLRNTKAGDCSFTLVTLKVRLNN